MNFQLPKPVPIDWREGWIGQLSQEENFLKEEAQIQISLLLKSPTD